jgi:hypothetical protein
MRSLLIIGLGLSTFALNACGDNSSATLKGGACKTDSNCAGGQICMSGVCVSARGDASSGGTGGPGGGGAPDTGGGTGSGGFGVSDGGLTGSGGVSGGGAGGGAGGRASTDGGPSSGGVSGTGGTPAGGVTCDTKTCQSGQTCCYAPANPRVPMSTATYTCTTSLADGGAGCAAGSTAISCTSTDDCAGTQKCCEVIGRTGVSYSCLDQCARGSAEAACTATSCGGTQVCCENLGGGTTPAGLACAATCAAGEYLLCTVDADCPAPARGGVQTTCLFSRLSPLFKVCR